MNDLILQKNEAETGRQEVQKELETLKNQMSSLRTEKDTLNSDTKHQIAKLEREMFELREDNNDLIQRVDEEKKIKESAEIVYQNEIKELKQKIMQIQNKMQEIREKNDSLRQKVINPEIGRLSEEPNIGAVRFQQRIESLENTVSSLKSQLTEKEHEADMLNNIK